MNNREIENIASKVLAESSLDRLPIDPVTLANKHGIKINNAIFSEENLSGLIAKRGETVTILINQKDSPARKRFTIAHELGHHFLHLSEDGEFVDSILDLYRTIEVSETHYLKEVEANMFAAALLMPKDLVKEEFLRSSGDVSYLTKRFNVSETALMFRLKKLRLL